MPYYRGDYYRGDPFLGGILSAGAKLLGGPVGRGILRVGGRLLGGARKVGRVLQRHPIKTTVGAGIAAELGMKALTKGGGGGGSRRMNITNVKALRRAGRRVRGFLKLARRFGAMPISPKGKKLFKARRRR